ncbi:MAG: hypothetical protein ACL7AX_12535 [Candidatus Arsenophonus phytopathogenicus]
MKYTYTLTGFRRAYQGRPDVRFTCCKTQHTIHLAPNNSPFYILF